jgi:hypothetical protein
LGYGKHAKPKQLAAKVRLAGRKSSPKGVDSSYFSAAGSGGVVFGGARWCVACS